MCSRATIAVAQSETLVWVTGTGVVCRPRTCAVMVFWSKKPPREEAPAARPPLAGETPTGSAGDPRCAIDWEEEPGRSSVPARERVVRASTQAPTETPEPMPPGEAPTNAGARAARRQHGGENSTTIPARGGRAVIESQLVRLIATGGSSGSV